MSSKVLGNVNLVTACSPVSLSVSCDDDTPANYKVEFSDEKILFDRRGITHLGQITFCVDKPVFLGCSNLDFTKNLNSELGAWSVTIQEVDGDGNLVGSEIQTTLEASSAINNDYKLTYTLLHPQAPFNLAGEISICSFTQCKFVMTIKKKLTGNGGFALCDPPKDRCASLCGGLTICGTSPFEFSTKSSPPWTHATAPQVTSTNIDLALGDFFNGSSFINGGTIVFDGSDPINYPFAVDVSVDVVATEYDDDTYTTPTGISLTGTVDLSTPTQPQAVFASPLPFGFWCIDFTLTEISFNGDPCPDNTQVVTSRVEVTA